jgi:hypothetical protein
MDPDSVLAPGSSANFKMATIIIFLQSFLFLLLFEATYTQFFKGTKSKNRRNEGLLTNYA